MFTDSENIKLRECCQRIVNAPRAFDQQPSQKIEGFAYCDDWEIIELLKCLFNGDAYWKDPEPNRLKNNPLWTGKEDMMGKAVSLVEQFKTVEAIIKHLDHRRQYGSN